MAKAEQERKAERQKLANEQAAINGKRFLGGPRPFGYGEDHVTVHPVEGPAVAEACAALLGGGTVSGIMREWTKLELTPPQRDRRGTTRWNRASIRSILLNPRIAGLSVYHGEIVGQGQWEPLVIGGDVAGGARASWRTRPVSRRGGCGRCWAGWRCARAATWWPGGRRIPGTGSTAARCRPGTGPGPARTWPARPSRSRTSSTRLVVGRLSRPDAADLVAVPESGPDVVALREEAAAIRRNLEEMAADRALGLITRPQLLAATGRANLRLEEIGAELEHAARENVLAPLVAAENAAQVWEDAGPVSRKRAVIKTLMSITLHSPGRGARRPFDPATVKVTWRQPDAA